MSIEQYQKNLFSQDPISQTIVLKDQGLDAEYHPQFFDKELANVWFKQLLEETPWTQDCVTVYGKKHLTPRLSCWMGDSWMTYTYSNHTMHPQPWQPLPLAIKSHIETRLNTRLSVQFNSVLLNYYRDGKDSNGWHADDEPELGLEPVIASVSLGAARDFHLRQKSNHGNKHSICLEAGSLLLMRASTQRYWQHQIPKRSSAGARINLTFRTIIKP